MTGTGAGLRFRAYALLLTAITALACARTAPTGVDPETVHLNIKQLTLSDGDSTQLTATVRRGGRTVDGVSLDWTSTNRDVIRVNGSGKVKAIGPGTGKVVARSGNGSDTATVVVTPPPASLEIGPQSHDFTATGQTKQFTAQALDDSGNILTDVAFNWSSSNASVATVDSMGRVTSNGAGTATIVVATVCCALSASAAITVADEEQNVSPGDAWFSDNFESGDLSRTANGFSWGGSAFVGVDNVMARSGSRSLHFQWHMRDSGKLNANSEQRFHHPEVTEYWVEFYIYYPLGNEPDGKGGTLNKYAHVRVDSGNNNKFFSAWGPAGYSTAPDLCIQTWGNVDEVPNDHINFTRTVANYTGTGSKFRTATSQSPRWVVSDADRGRWIQARIHIKISDIGASNGILQLWKDGALIINLQDEALWDFSDPQTNVAFAYGYLQGWRNDLYGGRSDVEQDVFIDDFAFYASAPGW